MLTTLEQVCYEKIKDLISSLPLDLQETILFNSKEDYLNKLKISIEHKVENELIDDVTYLIPIFLSDLKSGIIPYSEVLSQDTIAYYKEKYHFCSKRVIQQCLKAAETLYNNQREYDYHYKSVDQDEFGYFDFETEDY
jgi:uncharacterized protein YprB with RNaseH-like and TPR domain